jgi:hypothetical protein
MDRESDSRTILQQNGAQQSLRMSLQGALSLPNLIHWIKLNPAHPNRYTALLVKIKQTEESLRRVNKKPTFSLFGARNAAGEERDDERIRAQMMLDVDALGDEARALGLGLAEVVETSEGYKELKRVAALGEAEPQTPT